MVSKEFEFIQAQIIDVERLIKMCENHPLMFLSLTERLDSLKKEKEELLITLLHEIFDVLPANVVYEEMIYYDTICEEWEKNQDLDDMHDLLLEKGYYDNL